ncbi:MAG: DUF1801 domain-containing protein [Chitinophagaceae bacterium]
MNPKVKFFFDSATQWRKEFEQLRAITLECGLTEELKWGCPCYTVNKTNVVLIHGFKDYCALLFMKGALLKDEKKILIQQTANVQAARQIRFTSEKEILKLKTSIKAYIREAMTVEKAGLKVEMKKTTEFNMPKEFKIVLDDMAELKTAFYNLTPGRQRGYLLHFSSAKQAKTREQRIEKYVSKILDGKGLED